MKNASKKFLPGLLLFKFSIVLALIIKISLYPIKSSSVDDIFPPPLKLKDIPDVLAGMYEHNGDKYISSNTFDLISWTQGKVNDTVVSAITGKVNLEELRYWGELPVICLNLKPYVSPINDGLVRFSFLFLPNTIRRIGQIGGYVFHLDRDRKANDDVVENFSQEKLLKIIKEHRNYWECKPLPLTSKAEVEFMNKLEGNYAKLSTIILQRHFLSDNFKADNAIEEFLYLYFKFKVYYNDEKENIDNKTIEIADQLHQAINQARERNINLPLTYLIEAIETLGDFYYDTEKDGLFFNCVKKAANLGSIASVFNVGVCYQYGMGVKKNIEEAIFWYKKAARYSDAQAMFELGQIHEHDLHDIEKAIFWYKRATETDHENLGAILAMARINENIFNDYKEAIFWYRRAAQLNDPDAMFKIGYIYEKYLDVKKRFAIARRWYEEAKEFKHKESILRLAGLCASNIDIKDGLEIAIKLYMEMALRMNIKANIKLVDLFSKRMNKPLENIHWFDAAKSLCQREAKNGNVDAIYFLGYLYEKEKKYQQAYFHYQRASLNGDDRAKVKIAIFYAKGLVVDENPDLAKNLLLPLARSGNDEAMFWLGQLYKNKLKSRKRYKKALRWYKEAAKIGNFKALTKIGRMYEMGLGVDKNIKKAMEFYRKAIVTGDDEAMYFLARIYESNTKYKSKAIKWYEKAIGFGNKKAKYRLKLLQQKD